jgi:hypothetical protein
MGKVKKSSFLEEEIVVEELALLLGGCLLYWNY